MEYRNQNRGPPQSERPVSTGREQRGYDNEPEREDTVSERSYSESDRDSVDSRLSDDDKPLTPEDRALLEKMEAEAAADKDADAEAMAKLDKIERRRRKTPLGLVAKVFAAPMLWLEQVYANPNSLMTFHPKSEIRMACDKLRQTPSFEMFIFGCVIINGVIIGLQKPDAQMDAGASAILPVALSTTMQAIFLVVFTLEAVVKIIALGFLIGENTYLREYWNMLDFIVVVAGLVDLVSSSAGAALSPLRLIRTLQPLRALNKFRSGRLVLETLGQSLPMLMDVVLFMLWFVVSMTVMGTMFFGGTMTGRKYYPRSEFESLSTNPIVYDEGGATRTEAEFDLARNGYFPQACVALLDQWKTNNSLGTASGTDKLVAGFTTPSDEDMCLYTSYDRKDSEVLNYSSSVTITTNATTNVTTTTNYYGYDQPFLCCDSNLAPFDDYVRFDNFAQGVFVVLQMMTVDGWNEVTWPMCDTNGFVKPFLFAAAVVVIGGFVVIQLFTSVICATLGDVNQDTERVVTERNDVDAVVGAALGHHVGGLKNNEAAAAMAAIDKEYQEAELATAFRHLVNHPYFDTFIMSCITINSLMMISSHYDPAEWYVDTMYHLESAFVIIFIVEFSLKHIALGIGGYWGETWNRLDGFIVLSSIVELIMVEASSGGSGVNLSFLRVFRIFRIIRTFRVLRENKEFVRILESAITGIQAMWVFLVVWALLLIIFAILGVQLFGGQGDLDDARLGFKDVGAALLTLFVVSTGENTFEVAYATIQATDEWSGLYMIAWLVISTAVLSLILGILIDSITAAGDEEQGLLEEEAEKKLDYSDEDDLDDDDEYDDDAYFKKKENPIKKKKEKSKEELREEGFAEMERKRRDKAVERKRNAKLEKKKQSHSKADVAVVRRWLVSIGETTHTKESLTTEQSLSAGAKLAARRRLDAFDAKTKKRPGKEMSGIGSVQKLHDVDFYLKDSDDEKLHEMKKQLSQRVIARQKEKDEAEVVISKEECTNDVVTWQRVRPPRWKRADIDIVLEDEDGAPKSEVRLRREEEEFHRTQKIHRANLAVILDVLRIPNPGMQFSGGPEEDDPIHELMNDDQYKTMNPRLHAEPSQKLLRVKHATEKKRGWGGGYGTFGLEGGHLRLFTLRLVTHPLFELLVLISIGVSSGLLAAETHTFPDSDTQTGIAFYVVDIIFTVLFTLEMVLKMYAFQLWENPAAYLRSYFNVLDVVVVLASLLTLAFESVGALRALRLLRALRPLRSIHRLPALRLVINAVMASVPAISHVCVLGLGLGTVLSIMGMELFQGKMWYCAWVPDLTLYETYAVNVTATQRLDTGGGLDKTHCLAAGGVWRNNKFNFDNFAEAMVSVFVISTGDNWQDIMYVAMDSVGDGKAPSRDHSSFAAAYFVLVVLVAMLFWANLFVSALVDNFNRMAATGGPTLVSDEQRRWQQAMRLATLSHLERWRLAPPKGAAKIRRVVHYYCKQPAFDHVVISIIFLNLCTMVAYRTNATSEEVTAQEVFDYFFTFFYVLEALLLITAMGWQMYWSNFMYKVDFLVAVAGFVDFAIPSLREAGFGDAFRVARFLRLMKLIKISRGLRTLSLTFIQSLPAVVNISALSALVIFIYACLGVSLYGDNEGPFGGSVDSLAFSEYSNFLDFPRAFVVLFVSYTGNWMSYFSDMFRDQRCDSLVIPESVFVGDGVTTDLSCLRDVSAIFYCFTFVVVAIFLLANLFVAVILEQFSACADSEGVFGGSGIVDLVITTVQLRKVARLIKGRVVRHKHATGALGYTSISKREVPILGGGGAGSNASSFGKQSSFGSPVDGSYPVSPVTREQIKTAIAEAANAANANKKSGRGPVEPLDAAAEAVLALVDEAGVTPRKQGVTHRNEGNTPVSPLGTSRFGSRGVPSKSPRASPGNSGNGGFWSNQDGPAFVDDDDVSDAGRSVYSVGAPSQRGDGDSDEDDFDEQFDNMRSGGAKSNRSTGRFSIAEGARARRGSQGSRQTYVPDTDIDLDDML